MCPCELCIQCAVSCCISSAVVHTLPETQWLMHCRPAFLLLFRLPYSRTALQTHCLWTPRCTCRACLDSSSLGTCFVQSCLGLLHACTLYMKGTHVTQYGSVSLCSEKHLTSAMQSRPLATEGCSSTEQSAHIRSMAILPRGLHRVQLQETKFKQSMCVAALQYHLPVKVCMSAHLGAVSLATAL